MLWPWKGRSTSALLALLLVASPAAAHAWGQQDADAQNSRQSGVDGPADPGLLWFRDLEEDGWTSDSEVSATGTGINHPVIAADGTVMLRVGDPELVEAEGRHQLMGLDPATGQTRWTVPGVSRYCTAATDSAGRVWTQLNPNAMPDGVPAEVEQALGDQDDPALAAIDPATGRVLPETVLAEVDQCVRSSLHIGGDGDSERLLAFGGRGDADIVAVDVSGSSPAVAWRLDASSAPFDALARDRDQGRIAAFTDASVVIPTLTDTGSGTQLELVELDLTDGSLLERVALATYESDGSPADDAGDLTAASVVVVGDHAVVGSYHFARGAGALHGVELAGDWDAAAWSQPFAADDFGTRVPGVQQMAAREGQIIAGVGVGQLLILDATTGASVAGTGIELRENGPFEVAVGADGTIFTTSSVGPDRLERSLLAVTPQGEESWSVTRAALLDAIGIADGDLRNSLHVGPIDDQGTLYLFRGAQLIAIDGSGGLVEGVAFTDVDPDGVHATNIGLAVDLGITTGFPDGTFRPRQEVTREQMATFLMRTAGLEPDDPGDIAFPGDMFDDVNPDGTHALGIAAVAEAGITTGFPDGTFRPQQRVTREQMATFLVRTLTGGSGGEDRTSSN